MKLTIENWSYLNIKTEIKDFSHIEKVELAVFCAEKVIDIFESNYPDDKLPRLVIEAAKEFIKNPTEENKRKCKVAADTAYAACTAYAAYSAYAAAAAYAAADAAAYAAADTAYATATAATATAAATAAADSRNIRRDIINFIESVKCRPVVCFSEIAKPVYSQEMADNGELPPVGSLVVDKRNKCEFEVLLPADCNGYYVMLDASGGYYCELLRHLEPIDTRTDKEKLIDELKSCLLISDEKASGDKVDFEHFKQHANDLLNNNKFDIKLK